MYKKNKNGKYINKYNYVLVGEEMLNRKAILDFLLVRYKDDNKIDEELLQDIKTAISEIEVAQAIFNSVSDPRLIEAAIYREEAAKRKFEYLLSIAKEKCISR